MLFSLKSWKGVDAGAGPYGQGHNVHHTVESNMIARGDNTCDDVDYLQVATILMDDPDFHLHVFDEADRGVSSTTASITNNNSNGVCWIPSFGGQSNPIENHFPGFVLDRNECVRCHHP